MATSALARASILCVRGPSYEYNGRGYAVLPGVDIRCHACYSVFTVNKELNSRLVDLTRELECRLNRW
jgi:hypothetical protein